MAEIYSKYGKFIRVGDKIMCNYDKWGTSYLKGVNYRVLTIYFRIDSFGRESFLFEVEGENYKDIPQKYRIVENDIINNFLTNSEIRKLKLEKIYEAI